MYITAYFKQCVYYPFHCYLKIYPSNVKVFLIIHFWVIVILYVPFEIWCEVSIFQFFSLRMRNFISICLALEVWDWM